MLSIIKTLFTTLVGSLLLFGATFGYTELVANSRYLALSTAVIRAWAEALPQPTDGAVQQLLQEARTRVQRYDRRILQAHLVDGMVVNRSASGRMLGHCDSLLFSSLRFVSLVKLGYDDEADAAWTAIQDSRSDGRWLRHPRCPRSTSRDMLVGLLIALSQNPPHADEHLKELMQHVAAHNGYFGTGPIYVSYLTPGLARFIALMAPNSQPPDALPEIIRDGYSTAELEVMVTDQGYESHLGALTAWLEMEIAAHAPRPEESPFTSIVSTAISPFIAVDLREQRLDWITDKLVATDRSNLFFRYLRLRAANALTPPVRYALLSELLQMPQFPADHLPMSCDRRADYFWQRATETRNSADEACGEEYSGTDFLWMTAMLLEGWNEPGAVSH